MAYAGVRAVTVLLAAFALSWAPAVSRAQGAPVTKTGVRGDVVTIDAASKLIQIRGTDGATVRVNLIDATQVLGVEPGKTSLEGAVAMKLGDLKAGDKVWARGTDTLSDGTLVARQVIVMSATAIEDRNRRDAAEWRQRGTFGAVQSVDAAAGTLVIEARRGGTVTVHVTPQTQVRRMKPGATDLAGASPIGLADLKAGDEVAVRYLPTQDPADVTAETVLTGDFPRRAGGRVVSVDAAKGEVKVQGRDGQPQTILITASTMTRQFVPPPQQPGAPGAAAEGGERRGPGGPGGRRGMMGFGVGPAERAELEQRTKPLALADLAAGDFVFAVAEPGAKGEVLPASILIKVAFPAGQRPNRGPEAGQWDILPGGGPN